MSTNIENYEVKLGWDDSQFEAGIKNSLALLDKIKSALNFSKHEKAFKPIEDAAKSVDLSSLETTLASINKKLTAFSGGLNRELINIERQVVSTTKKIAKSLTIDQVTAGWEKYADKTKSVQTIMASTGEAIDAVNKKLDVLQWYADETSYSFTDMISNIGKFTANGVGLDQAVRAMEGISNWAAISGRLPAEAGRVMYNLSQALSMGAVKIIDWKSVEMANMATQEFKQTAIDTAVELKQLKKDAKGVVTTIEKGTKVTANTFRETLKEGWFQNDVLLQTLEKYAGFTQIVKRVVDESDLIATQVIRAVTAYKNEGLAIDDIAKSMHLGANDAAVLAKYMGQLASAENDLGYRSMKAAQEAVTFREAINATKDAVSSKWSKTFELIIGDYETAKTIWSDLAELLYTIFAEGGDIRNEILQSWSWLGGQKDLIDGIRTVVENLGRAISPVIDAFKALIPDITAERLVGITYAFRRFADTLYLSDEKLKDIRSVVDGLLKPLEWAKTLISKFLPALKTTVKILLYIGNVTIRIISLGFKFIDTFAKSHSALSMLSKMLGGVGSALSSVFRCLSEGARVMRSIQIGTIISNVSVILSGAIIKLVEFAKRLLHVLVSDLPKHLSSGFGFAQKIVNGFLHNISEKISSFSLSSDKFGVISNFIDGLSASFSSIKSKSLPIIDSLADGFANLYRVIPYFLTLRNKITEYSTDALDSIRKVFPIIKKYAVDGASFISSWASKLLGTANYVGQFIRESTLLSTGLENISVAVTAMTRKSEAALKIWFGGILSYISIGFEKAKNELEQRAEGIPSIISNLKSVIFEKVKTAFSYMAESIPKWFSGIKSSILGYVKDSKWFSDFIGRFSISGFADGLLKNLPILISSIKKVISIFKAQVQSLLGIHSKSTYFKDFIAYFCMSGWGSGMLEWVSILLTKTGDAITRFKDFVVSKVKWALTAIKNAISPALKTIGNLLSNSSEIRSAGKNTLFAALENIIPRKSLSELGINMEIFEEAIDKVKAFVSKIIDILAVLYNKIPKSTILLTGLTFVFVKFLLAVTKFASGIAGPLGLAMRGVNAFISRSYQGITATFTAAIRTLRHFRNTATLIKKVIEDGFTAIVDTLAGIPTAIQGLIDAEKAAVKKKATASLMNAFALSILAIAGSLKIISTIDTKDLYVSLDVLGQIALGMVLFVGTLALMDRFVGLDRQILGVAAYMGAIALLISQLKGLNDLKFDDINKYLPDIAIYITGAFAIYTAMSIFLGQNWNVGNIVGLLAFSFAMSVFMKSFANLLVVVTQPEIAKNIQQANISLPKMIGLLAILGAIAIAASKMSLGTAATLLVLANMAGMIADGLTKLSASVGEIAETATTTWSTSFIKKAFDSIVIVFKQIENAIWLIKTGITNGISALTQIGVNNLLWPLAKVVAGVLTAINIILVLRGGLGTMFGALKKIFSFGEQVRRFGIKDFASTILSLSASFLLISAALKSFSKLSEEYSIGQILGAAALIVGFTFAITGVVILMSKFMNAEATFKGAAKAMLGAAIATGILGLVFKSMVNVVKKTEWTDVWVAVGSMMGLMAMLALICATAQNLQGAGLALISMAIATSILAIVISILASIKDPSAVWAAGGTLAIGLVALAGAMWAAGRISKEAMPGIVALSAAIVAVVVAIGVLSFVLPDANVVLPLCIGIGLALLGFAVSLLAAGTLALASVPGILAMALVVGVVAGALYLLQMFDPGSMFVTAAAIGALVAALAVAGLIANFAAPGLGALAAVIMSLGVSLLAISAAAYIFAAAFDLVVNTLDHVLTMFPEMSDTVQACLTTIVTAFTNLISTIFNVGSSIITGLGNGILSGISLIGDVVRTVVDYIKGLFTGKDGFVVNSPSLWAQDVLGNNIILGLGQGLLSGLSYLGTTITSVVDYVKASFQNLFGIHSASEWFHNIIGWFSMVGMGEGMVDATNNAVKFDIGSICRGISDWFKSFDWKSTGLAAGADLMNGVQEKIKEGAENIKKYAEENGIELPNITDFLNLDTHSGYWDDFDYAAAGMTFFADKPKYMTREEWIKRQGEKNAREQAWRKQQSEWDDLFKNGTGDIDIPGGGGGDSGSSKAAKEAKEDLVEYTDIVQVAKGAIDRFNRAYGDKLKNTFEDTTETIDIASVAMEQLANQIYLQKVAAMDADKQAEELAKSAEVRLSNAYKAFKEFRDDIKKTIAGQIDFFGDTLDVKDEKGPEGYLKSMRNMLLQTEEYAQRLRQLGERGVSEGLYNALVSKGFTAEGFKQVKAFSQMSDAQIKEANELYERLGTMPDEIADTTMAGMANVAMMATEGWIKGFDQNAGINSANAFTSGLITTMETNLKEHSPSKVFMDIAANVVEGFKLGIDNDTPGLLTRMSQMAFDLIRSFSEKIENLKPGVAANMWNAGLSAVQGFARGIRENVTIIQTAAIEVANAAYDSVMSTLDANSPSKLMSKVGLYADQGLAIGLSDNSDLVTNASLSLGERLYSNMHAAIQRMNAMIMGEIDPDPVITPTLNLSRISAGASQIGAMFNNHHGYNLDATGTEGAGSIQNGGMTFVQNNYSPKALSRIDIYRQTKNQFAYAKGVIG